MAGAQWSRRPGAPHSACLTFVKGALNNFQQKWNDSRINRCSIAELETFIFRGVVITQISEKNLPIGWYAEKKVKGLWLFDLFGRTRFQHVILLWDLVYFIPGTHMLEATSRMQDVPPCLVRRTPIKTHAGSPRCLVSCHLHEQKQYRIEVQG